MNSIAIFDFDKTIVSKDTGLCFILYALKRNPFRLLLASIALPLVSTLFFTNRFRFIGNSFFLWISTVGMSIPKTESLRESFVNHYLNKSDAIIYSDAKNKIHEHFLKGDHVYIISGASTWMVRKIIRKIAFPPGIEVFGSNEHRFLGGMVSNFHCFGNNKVKVIEKHLNLKSYTDVSGYSDSPSDIPFLSVCHKKFIINPTLTGLKKFRESFDSEIVVLEWV